MEPGQKLQMTVDLEVSFNEVKWMDKNICHPGGLFPVGRWRTFIMAPSVYECWDESHHLYQTSVKTNEQFAFNPHRVPEKILIAVVSTFHHANKDPNERQDELMAPGAIRPFFATSELSKEGHGEEDHLFQELAPRLKAAKEDDAGHPLSFLGHTLLEFLCTARSTRSVNGRFS
jgi:hypothetical protein